jgi:peptide/nickel transport system substrate-binding protein
MKAGQDRRSFVQQLPALAALGLLPPQAARAQPAYAPTRRGGGGTLKLLFWQGPTLLNPHFATGQKDMEGSRLFYEPLAVWSDAGELLPVLAAEIPTRANGGVAADGRSVTWKLRKGVQWHDGQPFNADDVLFNWRYATDPKTAATTMGSYGGIKVLEKVDANTVRVVFDKPTPFWAGQYVTDPLIPRHLFERFTGASSREAPNNLKPVGTGPYVFADFKPGDLVRGRLNPNYHLPNRPHFDAVEIKGGGDAVSAARTVLQTGEYDFAWNLQVEDELLRRMEASGGGKGQISVQAGGAIEFLQLNFSDPNLERDGERSHPDTRHPLFSDLAVRQALALCVDRSGIERFIYGRTARATANVINDLPRFESKGTRFEFNPDKAAQLLEAAGWKKGRGGIREKNGRALRLLFATSQNATRQKTQQVIKQAAARAGIELELKAVQGAVFFSTDVANTDTYGKFYADIQMYTNSLGRPDPQGFMRQFISEEIARKANKWQGDNLSRWRSAEFDALYQQSAAELDPARRAALIVRMNDLLVAEGYIIPLVARGEVTAHARSLVAPISGWRLSLDQVHDWHRRA